MFAIASFQIKRLDRIWCAVLKVILVITAKIIDFKEVTAKVETCIIEGFLGKLENRCNLGISKGWWKKVKVSHDLKIIMSEVTMYYL